MLAISEVKMIGPTPTKMGDAAAQNLNQLYGTVADKGAKKDSISVAYGEGKFHLANRQSKVAAFLPTVLNRLLKPAPKARDAAPIKTLLEFRELINHQPRASAAELATKPMLTVAPMGDAKSRSEHITRQFQLEVNPQAVGRKVGGASATEA